MIQCVVCEDWLHGRVRPPLFLTLNVLITHTTRRGNGSHHDSVTPMMHQPIRKNQQTAAMFIFSPEMYFVISGQRSFCLRFYSRLFKKWFLHGLDGFLIGDTSNQ